ncbi:MAG: hypothetical protein U5Q44_11540 [Dehalococcoidia bacterium]|nr:hypothetical protein [Dehalococcoidia bacterium]
MATSNITVDADGARLDVTLRGEGPLVVMHPSLGRGAADFAALAESLAAAGYRTAAMIPSGSPRAPARLDASPCTRLRRGRPRRHPGARQRAAHLVGHAYGNRVMRCLASDHPDLVRSSCARSPVAARSRPRMAPARA